MVIKSKCITQNQTAQGSLRPFRSSILLVTHWNHILMQLLSPLVHCSDTFPNMEPSMMDCLVLVGKRIKLLFFGEKRLYQALEEYSIHCHQERNHQG